MDSEPLDNDLPDTENSDCQPSDDEPLVDLSWTWKGASGTQAQPSRKEKVSLGHKEVDRMFLEDIAGKDWTTQCHSGATRNIKDISQPARMIRDMIFAHVGGSPHIRRIAVEDFEYFQKGRMPRDQDGS
ncbi:hypothetical protein CPB97_003349 [Podila verticillata]|nr:hypothetical protein CPB97_003349 [Podila verticillata]